MFVWTLSLDPVWAVQCMLSACLCVSVLQSEMIHFTYRSKMLMNDDIGGLTEST